MPASCVPVAMPMSLPEDIEPFCEDTSDWHNAGAYALLLDRPADFKAEWANHYDRTPEWLDAAADAERLAYVGGSSDLLARLEDHAAGDVRTTVLTEVCDIDCLHTVWFAGEESYKQTEFRLFQWLNKERESWHVHQR